MEPFKGNPEQTPLGQTTEKKVNKPITTDAIVKKESKRYFAQDVRSAARNVLNESIIPNTKRAISDCFKRFIDVILYGTYNPISNSGNGYNTNYSTRPSSLYTGPSQNTSNMQQNYSRPSIYNLSDVEFPERGPVEQIIEELRRYVSVYGMASVADFYELCGIPTNHTDNKYGWKNLSNVTIDRRINGTYSIRFPRPEPIE